VFKGPKKVNIAKSFRINKLSVCSGKCSNHIDLKDMVNFQFDHKNLKINFKLKQVGIGDER